MTKAFWQAKIWGLLHDPLLKSLYQNKGQEGIWVEILRKLGNDNPAALKKKIQVADFIAAASDRPSWDQDNDRGHVDYIHGQGLHVSHLLSGKSQSIVMADGTDAKAEQDQILKSREAEIIRQQLFPLIDGLAEEEQHEKTFWWLWRCFPVAMANEFGENTALLPADTRIPDCSIWSHNSSVSAIAGSLIGLEESEDARPHLSIFSMTPVQEMIKASRKMQDFWAGSWLLHYLSAKVCWKWACKYGPDSLVYPNLYAQPLIDHWLLEKWPDFGTWVKTPLPKQLLTAGFPNVLVAILPKHSVEQQKGNAFVIAQEVLRTSWLDIGNQVWDILPRKEKVNKTLLWDGWLKHQWQTYWTALPIGHSLSTPEGANNLGQGQGPLITKEDQSNANKIQQASRHKEKFIVWANAQNIFCGMKSIPEMAIDRSTLTWNPEAFDKTSYPTLAELSTYKQFNVGLWWSKTFDQLRHNLTSVKSARTWELPSVFSSRSTLSGIGSVLHPQQYDHNRPTDWVSESETSKFWQKERRWFDGREQLNATEVLKRGLRRVLPDLLGLQKHELAAAYPDLTVGVAGLLHQLKYNPNALKRYCDICNEIAQECDLEQDFEEMCWGIPWIDNNPENQQLLHPRLLNAGWLMEDCSIDDEESLKKEEKRLRDLIQSKFPAGANPTDWYVLAAGDGDDMGTWLKGTKLQPYSSYIPDGYPDAEARKNWEGVDAFLESPKRMGPATHTALSRALLDFSNQLVPYLTEERYAGRLIYSGGDDVLAYTNLWEWDSWLSDINLCFKGSEDKQHQEFKSDGDYWQWNSDRPCPKSIQQRPLFTMGSLASISFGITIANQGVPLAIALENLWEAEDEAKKHKFWGWDARKEKDCWMKKDAVQVRVIYGNGNVLKATAKFEAFGQWRSLLDCLSDLEPALFEQVAELWNQHPVPSIEAIPNWVQAFCSRREALNQGDDRENFGKALHVWLEKMWQTNQGKPDDSTTQQFEEQRDREIQNWLKLAAFVLRKRDIDLGGAT
jgi:CRISPR-associated protein Cmr2